MRGEWSGKIRSTPTPPETLRSAAAGLADHNAFEDLDTLLLALPNTEVDVDRVAHAERGAVT